MPEAHVVAGLEALLFAGSEPVPVNELARLLDVDTCVVGEALEALRKDYADPRRGFMLDEAAGGVRLVSKPAYAHLISELLRPVRSSGLSQAALETLSIVSYRQPVTRLDIETIRGVRADSALTSLLERGLIEEAGRKEAPGRPILYRTTRLFLVEFGLDSLDDLPPLEEQDEGASSDS
ncbi:MAG: SMC-Scp complex subunit ScpB [Limnochordia bacterium]|jgi:segregation and condensation protein B